MPKQAWVSDILKAPTEQAAEEPKQSNKAWISDILKAPQKEVETSAPVKAKITPPPVAIPAPKTTEPVSLNPAKMVSGLVKKFTAPSTNKRAAGYLDLLAAGAEQGVVPFLPQVAVKGGIGAAKSGQGALAKTAGGIEAVFDPNVTGYARTTGAQFPEHMTMPQEAALIGGNVLGTIAKAVASGGTGLADTAAKLGALGIAKQIGKRAGYETAKQGLGVGSGMLSAMGANKVLEMTPVYQEASPEEQRQMSTIVSAASGIGGGISADRLASLGIRNIKPLAQARDLMVKGSEIPTYAEAERAKGIKEATNTEPAQEILKTTEPKMQEPVEQAATAEAVNKGGVYPSEVTDIEAQALSNIRKSHSKIAKATFKAEDTIVKPYENATLREPSKVADQDFSTAVKNIQNVAKTEAIPEQPVKLTDYEPAGYSQLSSGIESSSPELVTQQKANS